MPAAPEMQAAAPMESDAAYFYDTLAPYGSWVNVPEYGVCWQPTVVVSTPGWRPYLNSGRWVWSDCGWYWNSDYSWGWAPFHYGRWFYSGNCGWVWSPGRVWGPAWVSWRNSDDYCGWAPLPPEAGYTVGVGLTYYGNGAAVDCEFGLGWSSYSFVAVGNFTSALTSTHIIATITRLVILLLLFVIGWPAEGAGEPMKSILVYLSVTEHFQSMLKGVLDTRDLVYFASVTIVFLFLTHRAVESARWK